MGASCSTRRATARFASCARGAARPAGSSSSGPRGPSVYNPTRAGQRDGDRRQGARRRALHRAALPAPGAALSRARSARAAQSRRRGQPRRRWWSNSTRRPGGARPQLPEEEAQGAHEYLDKLTPRQQSDLAGVRDRLAIMAESDIGPWLDPETEGGSTSICSTRRKRSGRLLQPGADRGRCSRRCSARRSSGPAGDVAALQGRPVPTLVVIDEFSAIAAGAGGPPVRRARSTGISLLLGTQELADLRVPGRELLQEQVLGNLSA